MAKQGGSRGEDTRMPPLGNPATVPVAPRVPNPATDNEGERGTRAADRHHVDIPPGGGR